MDYLLIIFSIVLYTLLSVYPSVRGKLVYSKFKYDVSLKTLVEIMMMVNAANVLAPFRAGGVLIRSFILKRMHNIPHQITLSVTSIEQLFQLSFQGVTVFLSLYFIGFSERINVSTTVILSSAGLLILLLLFFWKKLAILLNYAIDLLDKIIPKFIASLFERAFKLKKEHFAELLLNIQESKRKNYVLGMCFFLTLSFVILYPAPLLLFVKGLGFDIDYIAAFAIYWLPMFLGNISGIPGGFGVREGSMIYLFTKYGLSIGDATEATVWFRIATIIILLALGFFFAAKYNINFFRLKKLKNGIREENNKNIKLNDMNNKNVKLDDGNRNIKSNDGKEKNKNVKLDDANKNIKSNDGKEKS